MDVVTKELQTYLVKMAYEGCTHEQEHQMQHLVALLEPADEEALTHYFGLFGETRLSLYDIAKTRHETPEQTLAAIGKCLRKLAITPEWQTIKPKTT
ncbi:MAG: hypothetical protein K5683_08995 [Prevotella sp.]|nr:hypothetical protein [Prevotella sp.]